MIAEYLFQVSGNKIETLFLAEEALLFSSSTINSVEKFQEAWDKKLSLATKVKVKYKSIKSVRKENQDNRIHVYYKTAVGITSQVEFSFFHQSDYDIFFDYLTTKLFFNKTEETLTPFKAIQSYLLGLVVTIVITAFSVYHASQIANGTADEATSGKERLFNQLLEILGPYGTLAIGVAIGGFILYQIWKRFTNPPDQVRFSSPNF